MNLIASVCALVLPALQAGPVEIRWKFTEGQELRYEVAQQTTTRVQDAGQDQTTTTTYHWTVRNVAADGTATIRMKYDSLRIKASGLQEFEYDSRKGDEPPAIPNIQVQAKLVGQSFTMKMTPAGRVKDVEGFDKILDTLIEDQPEEQRELVKGMLEQMFSGETMESMFQQLTPALPEKKVSVGDAWKSGFTFALPMVGAMKFDIASKLVEVKDGAAAIDQTLAIRLDDEGDGSGLLQISEASGTTSSVFSLERGLFLSSTTRTKMKMSVAGQEIPVVSVSRLKLLQKRTEF